MSATTKTPAKTPSSRKPEKTAEDDPWRACRESSHIPNAETAKSIEEGLAEKSEPVAWDEFCRFLEEK